MHKDDLLALLKFIEHDFLFLFVEHVKDELKIFMELLELKIKP